jgi:hypothetical protein
MYRLSEDLKKIKKVQLNTNTKYPVKNRLGMNLKANLNKKLAIAVHYASTICQQIVDNFLRLYCLLLKKQHYY